MKDKGPLNISQNFVNEVAGWYNASPTHTTIGGRKHERAALRCH